MRREGEAKDLVVLAFHAGFEKERGVRRYFDRHEFRFTPLMKSVEGAETPFGLKLTGSAVLIGPDGRVLWRGLKLDRAAVRKALGIDAK